MLSNPEERKAEEMIVFVAMPGYIRTLEHSYSSHSSLLFFLSFFSFFIICYQIKGRETEPFRFTGVVTLKEMFLTTLFLMCILGHCPAGIRNCVQVPDGLTFC